MYRKVWEFESLLGHLHRNMKTIDYASISNQIHQKIIDIYPFLTPQEKKLFEQASKKLLKRPIKTKQEWVDLVTTLLQLLRNGHADIFLWRKTSSKTLQKPTIKIINETLYITVPSWDNKLAGIEEKLIDFCWKNRKEYHTILIDVRGNNGGNSNIAHHFASIFFKKEVGYGTFKYKKANKITSRPAILRPHPRYYIHQPITLLIDEKCFSSNELFIAPFKVAKRALIAGRITRGGSGNPIMEEIMIGKSKYIIRIPTWRFFLKGERKPVEETKITPDIFLK